MSSTQPIIVFELTEHAFNWALIACQKIRINRMKEGGKQNRTKKEKQTNKK
jgi:hypothetical protein